MKKPNILLIGPKINSDTKLHKQLETVARVLLAEDAATVKHFVQSNKIKLLVIEKNNSRKTILLIEELKNSYPQLVILLIDDMRDQQFLATAFQLGVKDAFHKPYKIDLLVERVSVLLEKQ